MLLLICGGGICGGGIIALRLRVLSPIGWEGGDTSIVAIVAIFVQVEQLLLHRHQIINSRLLIVSRGHRYRR